MLVKKWRIGNTHTLLVETQIGATTMENSIMIPQKVRNITNK